MTMYGEERGPVPHGSEGISTAYDVIYCLFWKYLCMNGTQIESVVLHISWSYRAHGYREVVKWEIVCEKGVYGLCQCHVTKGLVISQTPFGHDTDFITIFEA